MRKQAPAKTHVAFMESGVPVPLASLDPYGLLRSLVSLSRLGTFKEALCAKICSNGSTRNA